MGVRDQRIIPTPFFIMGMTNFDQLNAKAGRLQRVTQLPQTPQTYYGESVNVTQWVGGEIVWHSGDNGIYIQTATSGTTPTWRTIPTKLT